LINPRSVTSSQAASTVAKAAIPTQTSMSGLTPARKRNRSRQGPAWRGGAAADVAGAPAASAAAPVGFAWSRPTKRVVVTAFVRARRPLALLLSPYCQSFCTRAMMSVVMWSSGNSSTSEEPNSRLSAMVSRNTS
jgi:hypothetical protein